MQERFFNILNQRFGKKLVLDTMMEHFMLKKGAAYKRMNGTSILSVSELNFLADHFNVSLDTMLQRESFLSFQHPFMDTSKVDFLEQYAYYLKPLSRSKGSKLIYMANEIPVFYYFSHQHIFNFLTHIWEYIHLDSPTLRIPAKTDNIKALEELRNEVENHYTNHEVTEIWNSNMLSNLYQQISFAITIRAFENLDTIDKIIMDLKDLINNLMQKATKGQQNENPDSKINVYLNEFGNYLNLVYFNSEKFSTSFIGLDIPHFIMSHSESFNTFAHAWLQKIMKRSILISGAGYQFRELFFIKMEKDFSDFVEKVDKLTAVYY